VLLTATGDDRGLPLAEGCRERWPGSSRPKRIVVADALPETVAAKCSSTSLRAEHAGLYSTP
jgi:hypothetical protein